LAIVVGKLFGKRFAEWNPAEAQPRRISFGFQFFSYRFIQWSIVVNQIESVEWAPGQATERMGRDMNDWTVDILASSDISVGFVRGWDRG
jgi:hypothetical protein